MTTSDDYITLIGGEWADPIADIASAWRARINQPGYHTHLTLRDKGACKAIMLLLAVKLESYSLKAAIPDDPDMSRHHARIFRSGSSWTIEDLGSSNGTFIGEFQTERKLSTPTAIKDGEIFRVGLTRLRLGGLKDERVAVAGAAAVAKGKRW